MEYSLIQKKKNGIYASWNNLGHNMKPYIFLRIWKILLFYQTSGKRYNRTKLSKKKNSKHAAIKSFNNWNIILTKDFDRQIDPNFYYLIFFSLEFEFELESWIE